MNIKEIKDKMIKWRDFYGGDLLDLADVDKAKTKKELSAIIERHRSHQESMLSDAHSNLDRFKKNLGLSL